MLLYIGKAATSVVEKDCPLNSILLSELISYIFDDDKRRASIREKFIDNRHKIDIKYKESGKVNEKGFKLTYSYEQALISRDRSMFQHVDLFPQSVAQKYPKEIAWFSSFLAHRMEEKHIKHVWSYIDKLHKQAGPIDPQDVKPVSDQEKEHSKSISSQKQQYTTTICI